MIFLRVLYFVALDYYLILKIHLFTKKYPFLPEKFKLGSRGDIVLIPGFNERWSVFRFLVSNLHDLGFRIHEVPGTKYGIFDIKKASSSVYKYIEANNLSEVILLSHSKGGLVAKYVLDNFDQERIKLSVSFAVPYAGTIWGYLYVFGLRELIPGSKVLKELKSNKRNNKKILNIYPGFDNHVLPKRSLILDGAENYEVGIVGHTRVLDSKKSLEILISAVSK